MTKDYEEYKAKKGKHKTANVLLTVLEVIITISCIIVGFFFLLMVALPKGLWVGLFQ